MTVALLTAAGVGSRMGQDIPKQFMHVDNKPLIIHTMTAFQNHPNVDAIIVVTLPEWKAVLQAYAKQFNITKLRWIADGGNWIFTDEGKLYLRPVGDEPEETFYMVTEHGNPIEIGGLLIYGG